MLNKYISLTDQEKAWIETTFEVSHLILGNTIKMQPDGFLRELLVFIRDYDENWDCGVKAKLIEGLYDKFQKHPLMPSTEGGESALERNLKAAENRARKLAKRTPGWEISRSIVHWITLVRNGQIKFESVPENLRRVYYCILVLMDVSYHPVSLDEVYNAMICLKPAGITAAPNQHSDSTIHTT